MLISHPEPSADWHFNIHSQNKRPKDMEFNKKSNSVYFFEKRKIFLKNGNFFSKNRRFYKKTEGGRSSQKTEAFRRIRKCRTASVLVITPNLLKTKIKDMMIINNSITTHYNKPIFFRKIQNHALTTLHPISLLIYLMLRPLTI